MKYWLVNRDPYNDLLYIIPYIKQPTKVFFIAQVVYVPTFIITSKSTLE